MRIKYITVDNMLCFGKDQTLKFVEPVYQVIGEREDGENQSNGTGKSSLYYIIQEVLFGKNIKKTLKDYTGNVFTDPNSYSAGVVFEQDGSLYSVDLRRKSKKATLRVLKDGEDISGHTVPETYKLISEILGLDYELFTMLTYLSPTISTPNTIFFGTPKEKKNLFTKLFNLGHILKTVDRAAEKGREANIELRASEKQINALEDIKVPTLPDEPDFEGLEELRKEKGALVSSQEQLKVMIEGHNSWLKLLAQKEELEISIERAGNPEYDPNRLEHWEQEYGEARALEFSYKEKLRELNQMDAECPTCGSKIFDPKVHRANIAKAKIELEAARDRVAECVEQVTKDKEVRKRVLDLENAKAKLDQVNNRLSDFDNTVTSIEEASLKHDKGRAKLVSLNEQIALLEAQITKYRQIEGQIATLKQMKLDQETKAKDLKDKVQILEKDLKIYSDIKEYLGLEGFISTKISAMAERLTYVINQYLEIFSNNSLYIKNHKLNFKLLKDGKELPINNLSAGQLTMIQLSSILALRDLITMNKGITVDLLVLDELFGTLDEVRRGILTDTLRDISTEGKHKVLSISHLTNDPSLPTITISQKEGISTICQ